MLSRRKIDGLPVTPQKILPDATGGCEIRGTAPVRTSCDDLKLRFWQRKYNDRK